MVNRRLKYRSGLHPLYLKKYDVLCTLLDEKWQPCQGLRSLAEQQKLFDQCAEGGPCVTNAKSGDSAHNYGCATDWTLFTPGGTPIWPEHDDPVWQEYENACRLAGVRWGKDFDDYPHNQLPLTVSWKSVGKVFREKGLKAALKYMQENVADE